MKDTLLTYYRDELSYLRKIGAEFKEKYPKIADRLLLDENESKDPHVERLLEGFAFLAARVHKKIDDDFPEITDALLNVVYPHYLRPIPSLAIVEFELDPLQSKLETGFEVPRGSNLTTRAAQGISCRFRTCYDTVLWPFSISAAEWRTPERLDPPVRSGGAAAVIRIELACNPDASFSALSLDTLRFYLNGAQDLPATVYELLLNNCTQILLRDPKDHRRAPVMLPPSHLRAAGFAGDESLLPYPRRSFDGYRLIEEYFAFPEKFLFVEIADLRPVLKTFDSSVELLFFLAPFEREERWQMLEAGVNARLFRPNAVPVANLFQQVSEPILLSQTRSEYRIVPDARRQRGMDVFSVDSVVSASPGSAEVIGYDPVYSFRHFDRGKDRTFWYATRRLSPWRPDGGADMYLALVDLSGRPSIPDVDSVTCRLTCTNRDLPSRLPLTHDGRDFELEGGGPVTGITALIRPTKPRPAPQGDAAFWRLISHLSLNHLSLVSEGKEALQEILRLYDSGGTFHQAEGIRSIASSPGFARVMSDYGISFARGTQVEMELDEERFVGSGVFLFSQVLERFFAMYASLNSFTQLTVRTPQRKEVLRRWPPRSGRKMLV